MKRKLFSFPILLCIGITTSLWSQSVVINEIVTDPQSDWSSNSFNGNAGSGTVSQGVDEYVELYIKTSGLDLTGWTIELNDTSPVVGDLTDSGAFSVSNYISTGGGSFTNTAIGDYLVLGNVTGSGAMSNSITILLKDNSGALIDSITLGGGSGEAFSGNADGIGDEAVYRLPNGTDTDTDDVDFSKGMASPGASNLTNFFWDGSANASWSNPANWATGRIPTVTDNVVIPNVQTTPIIESDTHAEINNLDVSNSTLVITDGSLKVNGVSSGSVSYSRNLETSNWYLMSVPLDGITFNDAYIAANGIDSGTGANLGIGTYDPVSGSWSYLQTGSSIAAANGTGYAVKRNTPGTVTFSGTMRTNDVAVFLLEGGTGNFNFIGNPFTSSISVASFLTDNSNQLVSQTIWIWNQATGTYEAKVTAENYILPPTQGFFVRAQSSGTVNFAKSYQTDGGTFQKAELYSIQINVFNSNQTRTAKLYFADGATDGFDNGWDGPLFSGVSDHFSLYTHLLGFNEQVPFQIQALPKSKVNSTVVPIGIKASKGDVLEFSVSSVLPEEIQVYLEDRVNNSFVPLHTSGASYSITLTEDLDGTGRFFLHTAQEVLSAHSASAPTVKAHVSERNLIVSNPNQEVWQLKLYSLLGKEILATQLTKESSHSIPIPQLNSGIYMLRLTSANQKLTKKIVLQ